MGALECPRVRAAWASYNKARAGRQRRRRAPHTRAIFSKIKGGASRKRRKSHPVRWRAWRRKSPCVGVVPEGDKDRAPAKASPFMELPSDATDSSSLTTFLETDGDRLSLKASPARSIAVRSEWPQNRKRNHPLHGEMDTSHINKVKTPQHDGTPRAHRRPSRTATRSLIRLVAISPCSGWFLFRF